MPGSGHLREGDVAAMLTVVEDARRDDPGEAFPWELFHGLNRLIPCDFDIVYLRNNYVEHTTPLCQFHDGNGNHGSYQQADPDPATEPFWDCFWGSFCSYPQRSGDTRSVILTTDFHRTARDRSNDPMAEVLVGIEHGLIVSIPGGDAPGEYRRILLRRSEDREFTERDRQVMALLRPHLQEIWLDAERRRAGVPSLTAREWQVLSMAAAGLSYAQIAAALVVSTSTVRKHMEHVRERLGVHSVRAAAAIAMPHAPAVAPRALQPRSARRLPDDGHPRQRRDDV